LKKSEKVATASPRTTRAGGSRPGRAPGQSEGERGGGGRDEDGTGAGISSIITAEFAEVRRDG